MRARTRSSASPMTHGVDYERDFLEYDQHYEGARIAHPQDARTTACLASGRPRRRDGKVRVEGCSCGLGASGRGYVAIAQHGTEEGVPDSRFRRCASAWASGWTTGRIARRDLEPLARVRHGFRAAGAHLGRTETGCRVVRCG
jgi:hypothetical protein